MVLCLNTVQLLLLPDTFCTAEGLVCPVIMKMLLSVWVCFGRLKPKPVLKWPPGLLKHYQPPVTPDIPHALGLCPFVPLHTWTSCIWHLISVFTVSPSNVGLTPQDYLNSVFTALCYLAITSQHLDFFAVHNQHMLSQTVLTINACI